MELAFQCLVINSDVNATPIAMACFVNFGITA